MRILWDFDGTLFDTYPAFINVMKHFIPAHISDEEILAELKVSFRHATKVFGLTMSEVEEFRRLDNDLSPDRKPPFNGVKDILEKSDLNVIMTHKPREEVMMILRYFKMEHYFTDLVAGDDGYPRKPDASSYRYLHNKHHLDLAVGDRLLDIIPAKEVGMKTCLFQNNSHGADMYVQDYTQLRNLLWSD